MTSSNLNVVLEEKTITVDNMQRVKEVVHLYKNVPDYVFKGAIFAPFRKNAVGLPDHRLDTNIDEYYKVLNEIVIPDSVELCSDAELYPERIKKLVAYNTPAFGTQWNFGVELIYRMVAPQEHQTPQNLTKMRILRIIMDLMFTMTSVLDDITDNSTIRRSKKSWYLTCDGGSAAAIYDGSVIGYIPFYLLRKHFRSDPGYTLLMEHVAQANTKTLIGQTIDVVGFERPPTHEYYNGINNYKAGDLMKAQPAFGAIHAGICDENIINKMTNIFHKFGQLFQIWDDFQDYYAGPEQSGKPPCDFYNAGTTWVSATAMKYFNPEQSKIFKECYGSKDPEKIKRVRRLYDEVDIPEKYIETLRNMYLSTAKLIEELPEDRFKPPFYSYMAWLISDVMDPPHSEA